MFTIFYALPAAAFAWAAAFFWAPQRAAALVCVSGATFSALLGCLHRMAPKRRVRRAYAAPASVAWTCDYCGEEQQSLACEAGRRGRCQRCRASVLVPYR